MKGTGADKLATARDGMVSTAHPEATRAAVAMLEEGGNAFDAAVAAALALGVCEPHASGLGGQTMVLYHDAQQRETVALDGSSRAPEAATMDSVPPEDRLVGRRATTVPSTPATLAHVAKHGRLGPRSHFAAAIRLAEGGYAVSPLQHTIQAEAAEALRKGGAARFFLDDGDPFAPDALHVQPQLAVTLRRLRDHGWMDFYTGRIGEAIAKDMRDHHGLVTERDLAHVPHPVARKVDLGRWRGMEVASFPPPGAGRVLIEILHILDRLPARLHASSTPDGAVVLARTIEQALMDHHREPRDPARHQMTAHEMLLHDHADRLAVTLQGGLPGETTHVSVMDKEGNAVALTQSIELFYGSCAASDAGFLYNNYLSAFLPTTDAGHPYALRPNGVPWSSVAPAILFRRGRPQLVVGSPGSDRIASSVAQVLLRLRHDPPMEAVDAPRLHARPGPPRTATVESRLPESVRRALAAEGFHVVVAEERSLFFGSVHLVMRHRRGFLGVADTRRDGTAGGPTGPRRRRPRPWRRA